MRVHQPSEWFLQLSPWVSAAEQLFTAGFPQVAADAYREVLKRSAVKPGEDPNKKKNKRDPNVGTLQGHHSPTRSSGGTAATANTATPTSSSSSPVKKPPPLGSPAAAPGSSAKKKKRKKRGGKKGKQPAPPPKPRGPEYDPTALFRLAICLNMGGKRDAAVRAMDRLLERSPGR